jgi:hypothetical protein
MEAKSKKLGRSTFEDFLKIPFGLHKIFHFAAVLDSQCAQEASVFKNFIRFCLLFLSVSLILMIIKICSNDGIGTVSHLFLSVILAATILKTVIMPTRVQYLREGLATLREFFPVHEDEQQTGDVADKKKSLERVLKYYWIYSWAILQMS